MLPTLEPKYKYCYPRDADGGNKPTLFDGKNKDSVGDCAICAISNALEIPYYQVIEWFLQRSPSLHLTGVRDEVIYEFLEDKGWIPVTRDLPINDIRIPRKKAILEVNEIKDEKGCVVDEGHVMAIINNTIHDAFDSRVWGKKGNKKPTVICGYWIPKTTENWDRKIRKGDDKASKYNVEFSGQQLTLFS